MAFTDVNTNQHHSKLGLKSLAAAIDANFALLEAGGAGTLTVDALTSNGDVLFTLGATEAFTLTGSDISAPIVMTNTMTTAAKTGCRALFNVKANVALGSFANALKGYMEFTGTSGATTGLASGICAELKTPNRTLPSGAYYPLEVEHVAGGTSVVSNGSGSRVGFIYMQNSADLDGDFDDNGYLMTVAGLTAGAGHILSAGSQTLKMQVGLASAESTKYMVLSDTENSLVMSAAAAIPISLTGAFTTGINIAADGAFAITVTTAFSGTAGLYFQGAATDGIAITGICGDGISVSGAATDAAIHILGDQVIGILYDVDGSATDGIKMSVDTSMTLTDGIEMSGAGTVTTGFNFNPAAATTGILVSGTAVGTGISITSGSLTDAIAISATTPVDGLHISSACSGAALNLSGANATSLAISGANTSTAVLISGTWGSSANYGAITLAGDAAGTALALGASATSLIGMRIDLTAAVTAGNDFMAIHSELETSGAMVDGFIIGTYQRVRIAHVAYENYAMWGRMDVNVAQTGDSGNQYLGVFGSVSFAAGAHALLATGGGYGVLGTASTASGATLDQPLIAGYFDCNATDNIAGVTLAVRARMQNYTDYGVEAFCQTSNATAGMHIRATAAATLPVGILFTGENVGGQGVITSAFKFAAATNCGAAANTSTLTLAPTSHHIVIDIAGTPYYVPVFDNTSWT